MSSSSAACRLRFAPLSRCDGSAGLEYAALLALVAAGLLCLSFRIALPVGSIFDQMAHSFEGDSLVPVPATQSSPPSQALPSNIEKRHIAIGTVIVGFLVLAIGSWILEASSRLAKSTSSVEKSPKSSLQVNKDMIDLSCSRFAHKRLQLLKMMINDHQKLLPSDLKVCDLMTTGLTTALPSTTANELRVIIAEHNFRHILICNGDGRLVGIVSDRDLRNVDDAVPATALMAECPTTVSSDSLVNNAITLLIYGHISSLPVVDSGHLVGILTTTDVVMTLQCTMLAVEQMVRDLRAGRGQCELEAAVS